MVGVLLQTYSLSLCVRECFSSWILCRMVLAASVGNDRQNKPTQKPNIHFHWLFNSVKDKKETEYTNKNNNAQKSKNIEKKHLQIKWPSTVAVVAAAAQLPSEPFRAHI